MNSPPVFVVGFTRVNEMLSLLLWRTGLAFELLILVRAVRSGMLMKFPYFYAYVFCVFCVSSGLYITNLVSPPLYENWYWPTQFATLLAGCGVILDIVRRAFAFYPGAERVAWLATLGILGATVLYVGLKAAMRSQLTSLAATVELERDLRVIQALLLTTILTIVFYYRITIGKNVAGLIVGFGAYVGASLMTLAVRAFLGHSFDVTWSILQSSAYLLSLVVWTITLWSYSPQPAPSDRTRFDGDYETLVAATREVLDFFRSYFRRTARS